MDLSGHVETFDLFRGQPHLAGDRLGKKGRLLLVSGRVGVSRLDGHAQHLNRRGDRLVQTLESLMQTFLRPLALGDVAV